MKQVNTKRIYPSGEDFTIGIVRAKWHDEYTSALEERARVALEKTGIKENAVVVIDVPGAFELPQGVLQLLEAHSVDAVIAIGCLIEGETAHFEHIANAVAHGIMRVGLDNGVPVIFGVLTVHDTDQAEDRVRETGQDLGYEWGIAAVEMAQISDGTYSE